MKYNFQRLQYGLSPQLIINILNISAASEAKFSAVINMTANLKFIGIPTSINWDASKIFYVAQPSERHN
ncbi:MAG: hypothetical protein AAF383_10645 [Cyanobacteria bacterium P01_A01_bin.83]